MRSIVLIACLFLASPVGAGIVGRHDYGPAPSTNPFIGDSSRPPRGAGRQAHKIEERIRRARDDGSISPREARRLTREARRIENMAARYGADGLSPAERRELELRTQALSAAAARAR